MPGSPRPKGKVTDIAFKILGIPQNLKDIYKAPKERKPKMPQQMPMINPESSFNQ